MLISSEVDYKKFSYCYNHPQNVDIFIKNIDDNKSNQYYINNRLFNENNNRAIFNIFELEKYSNDYFGNMEVIKSDVLKYSKDYNRISRIDINYDFTINTSSIDKYFTNVLFGIEFKTTFKKKFTILNDSSNKILNLNANKVDFNDDISLKGLVFKVSFQECNIKNNLVFDKLNSGREIELYNEGELIFTNTSFNYLKFDGLKISELKIEFLENYNNEFNYDNNIEFDRGLIEKIRIYGEHLNNIPRIGNLNFSHFKFNKDSEVFISYLKIQKFEFNSVTNLTDSFKITNVKVIENFNLEDVDFGRVIFNGLNLFNSNLNFKHPTFNNCIFNNVIWNEKCEINNNNLEELRDIYRQMKYVMDSLGDSITGSKFYKNEMNTQRKLIKKGTFSEKVIFMFGYYINDFGQSWFRPLLILFVFNYFLWSFEYIEIYSDITISLDLFTIGYWNNFFYNLSSYISYLLPFRKLVDSPSLFDLFARLSSALLIYQSVIAMRRKIER